MRGMIGRRGNLNRSGNLNKNLMENLEQKKFIIRNEKFTGYG